MDTTKSTKVLVYRPLKTNYKTQSYAENNACAKIDKYGNMEYPAKVYGKRTGEFCPSGTKSMYNLMGMKGHSGEDYLAWLAEPLYHGGNFDGWMKTEVDSAGGIGVDIISDEPLVYCEKCKKKHRIKLRYWHMQAVIGYDGRKVKTGEVIGLAGTTGLSSGVHLHLGYKFCDEYGNGLHTDNGYYGGMPIPMLQDVYVRDFVGIKDKLNAIQFTKMGFMELQLLFRKLLK